MAQQLDILIRATDQATPVFRQVAAAAAGSASQIQKLGDIADVEGVKKAGKFIGDFTGAGRVADIRQQGDEMRARSAEAYAAKVKETLAIEQQAAIVDKARAGALVERAAAAARLQAELRAINAEEKRNLQTLPTRPGERAERSESIEENREAAERAYQQVAERTAKIENDAKATDEARIRAIHERRAAATRYGDEMKKIAAAEKEATKAAVAGSRLERGAALAGGALLALKVIGDIGTAWDKASEKLEKGQIEGTREFAGELVKSLPIIGSVAQGIEQTMLVVSGTAAEMRKVNAEAAELDKKIAGQIATRAKAAELGEQYVGAFDTERQKVERESDARLKKIREIRKEATENGTIGQVAAGLDRDEATEIERRRRDIAKIENAADLERIAKQREVGDAIIEGEKRIADGRRDQIIAGLREQGREYEASIAEINAKYDDELAAIRGRRQDIDRQNGLSVEQRAGLQDANDRERDALARRRAGDLRRAAEQGETSVADRVAKVERETLDARAAAGDAEAERAGKILDIREKYLAIAKEIEAIEKNGVLTDEQRAELARRREDVATGAAREIEAAGRGPAVVEQGRRFASAVDGRFNRESVAARSQVDVYRDQMAVQKKTAEHTKEAADASKRAAVATENLLSFLRGAALAQPV